MSTGVKDMTASIFFARRIQRLSGKTGLLQFYSYCFYIAINFVILLYFCHI